MLGPGCTTCRSDRSSTVVGSCADVSPIWRPGSRHRRRAPRARTRRRSSAPPRACPLLIGLFEAGLGPGDGQVLSLRRHGHGAPGRLRHGASRPGAGGLGRLALGSRSAGADPGPDQTRAGVCRRRRPVAVDRYFERLAAHVNAGARCGRHRRRRRAGPGSPVAHVGVRLIRVFQGAGIPRPSARAGRRLVRFSTRHGGLEIVPHW